MDMYIRMYDELKHGEGDGPTIGIVLCADNDEDIARYSVMHGNEQLFASKYKLYLPTETVSANRGRTESGNRNADSRAGEDRQRDGT